MKHVAPEVPLDTDLSAVYAISVESQLAHEYANEYREEIKDYDLKQLFKEVSDLRIDYDRSGPLGIRILRILMDAIEAWIDRN